MHKVACDICGQDYTVLPERLGDWLECKMCQCQFEVAKHNFVVEKDEKKLSLGELWQSDNVLVVRRVVRGILILSVMAWLTWLFFVEPPPRVNYFGSHHAPPAIPAGEVV